MVRYARALLALAIPAFVLLSLQVGDVHAQGKKASKEGTTKAVFENDKLKSWEVTYKPGQGSSMQDRPGRLVHCISGGTMQRTYEDGKKSNQVWKAGETKWLEPSTFTNTNVGKTNVRLLIVQPK
ncbi:MAG: hypothetical protein JO035_09430 [Betaproteobacteria bacterium]|nr:hypothetical protein [Betaproteobacteria bacterium]